MQRSKQSVEDALTQSAREQQQRLDLVQQQLESRTQEVMAAQRDAAAAAERERVMREQMEQEHKASLQTELQQLREAQEQDDVQKQMQEYKSQLSDTRAELSTSTRKIVENFRDKEAAQQRQIAELREQLSRHEASMTTVFNNLNLACDHLRYTDTDVQYKILKYL